MFRLPISMPVVLLTLAACAPVTPTESSAESSAESAPFTDPPADAPGGTEGGQSPSDGAPGAVEGSAGAREVQPVPDEQIRVGPGLGEDSCKAEAAQGLLGRSASESLVNEAVRAAGANTVRVIPHDGMVTMDYRGDRLNIQLDEQGKIVAITCG